MSTPCTESASWWFLLQISGWRHTSAVILLLLLLTTCQFNLGSPMERNNHTYVALDTLHQENHCASNGEPCSSGNSDHYSGVSNSTKREGWANRSSPLEDPFCLEHVGQVVISLSNTHLQWHRPDNKHHKLVISILLSLCVTLWHINTCFLCFTFLSRVQSGCTQVSGSFFKDWEYAS